jgi:cell shape-determining protein MreC
MNEAAHNSDMQNEMNKLIAHVNAQKMLINDLTNSLVSVNAQGLLFENSYKELVAKNEALEKELAELKDKEDEIDIEGKILPCK